MRKRTIVATLILLALVVTAASACRPKVYTDGTYQAVSQANATGYTWAKVTIARDKITAVELKEFTGAGAEKDWATYGWPEAKEAWEVMPARFVAANDWNVDGVAKATGSANKYKEAVKFALEKAKAKPAVTSTYFKGTFFGQSDANAQGHGIAWVTIENDRITAVEVDDVTAEGARKNWETYPYPEANEARGIMAERFVAAGPGGVANVDIVAGSTGSSDKWKQAVQRALNSAKVK